MSNRHWIIGMMLVGALTGTVEANDNAAVSVTSNVSLATQYVSRGIRQTWGEPAVQGGIDWLHQSGWSAGLWMSGVDDRFVEGARAEIDVYGGYSLPLGQGSVSGMLYYYAYPGAKISATGTKFNYAEFAFGVTQGSAFAKGYVTVSRDFFGITNARGTTYVLAGINHPLHPQWTLNLQLGSASVSGRGNAPWGWRDIKAGITHDIGAGWSTSLAWTKAKGRSDAYARYVSAATTPVGQPLISDTSAGTLAWSLTFSR